MAASICNRPLSSNIWPTRLGGFVGRIRRPAEPCGNGYTGMSTFCFHRSLTATGFSSDRKGLLPISVEPAIADYHHRRAEAALAVLDSHLAQGNYLCAAEPTIADLLCYGDVAFAEICAFDLNRWPNVAKWAAESDAVARLQGAIRAAGNGGCGTVLDTVPFAILCWCFIVAGAAAVVPRS